MRQARPNKGGGEMITDADMDALDAMVTDADMDALDAMEAFGY